MYSVPLSTPINYCQQSYHAATPHHDGKKIWEGKLKEKSFFSYCNLVSKHENCLSDSVVAYF